MSKWMLALLIICGALVVPSEGLKDIHMEVEEPLDVTDSLLKIDFFKEDDVTSEVIMRFMLLAKNNPLFGYRTTNTMTSVVTLYIFFI